MSRGIGRRNSVLLAIVVLALLLGLVVAESLENSSGPSSSASTSVSLPTVTTSTSSQPENLTRYVNPFVGTGNSPSPCDAACGGDTFPGAAYPMGMVQWSPDTLTNPPGGYFYGDSIIKDLSLTHFSGRGCQVYEDFPFMPYVGEVDISPAGTNAPHYYGTFSHANETARPGYYSVRIGGPNVTAQLSVTPRTGMGRFVYPPSALSTMLINAGGSINNNTASGVTIIPGQDEVTGYASSTVGCGSNPYEVYFAAKFDRPFSAYGTWNGPVVEHNGTSSDGIFTGAFLVFDTTSDPVVQVQVGLSFVSVANAESNLSSEFAGFDLESVAQAAAGAWNAVLNSVTVTGGTYNQTATFYTALYHVFFHPNVFSDDNGEYIGFDGKVHTVAPGFVQYENINGWDDYRTQMQLLSILAPATVSDIAQSLINDAEQGNNGSLPRWEQANADSHGQSGDDGDIVIADAYAFGARNFDTSAALQLMLSGQASEREGYDEYVGLGYVPADYEPGLSSASITLEYANDDFAISQFAGALGNSSIQAAYLQRSGDWQNVFDTASGYVEPRNSDGSWVQGFTPTQDEGFQEGDSAQYSWMVNFDLAGLFKGMGGNATAVSRLDSFFTLLDDGPASSYAWMGNEPCVEVPWEYDFAQAPSHTQDVVREIQDQLYFDSPDGLPGNDDGGEMSSWYIFSAMGLYPEVTATGGFVVGSPLFTSVTVRLAGGSTLQIDAPQASTADPYVQGLSIDGSPTQSLWVPWSSVQGGATLAFTLGASPSSWGSSPQDAPPSFASG